MSNEKIKSLNPKQNIKITIIICDIKTFVLISNNNSGTKIDRKIMDTKIKTFILKHGVKFINRKNKE